MSERDSTGNNYDRSGGSDDDSQDDTIVVSITTHDANIQLKSSWQSVLKGTVDFFVKQFPEIDIAKKISLNYTTDYLIRKYSGLIKVTPEGEPQVIVPSHATSGSLDMQQKQHKIEKKELELGGEKKEEEACVEDNDNNNGNNTITKAISSSDEPRVKNHGVKRWSVKEFIALHLVAAKITEGLRTQQQSNEGGLLLREIEYKTQSNPKSVNSRLSEMVKSGYVIRDISFDSLESEEEPLATKYRITTVGIHWLNGILDKK